MSAEKSVEQLYEMRIGDLLAELGNEINKSRTFRQSLTSPSFAPLFKDVQLFSPRNMLSRIQSVRLSRQVISKFTPTLRKKICADWDYCNKRNQYAGWKELTTAVSPLIATVTGLQGYALLIATVVVLKKGLNKLCKCPKTNTRKRRTKVR